MNSTAMYKLTNFENDSSECGSSDSSSPNSFGRSYSVMDRSGNACDLSHQENIRLVSVNNPADYDEKTAENVGKSAKLPSLTVKNEENWAKLPSLAVEKIYSFLSRTDRSHMSLVCSLWAKEFSSPSLWKTMKFQIHERNFSPKIYPEVKFALKYAAMFRHVEIVCESFRTADIAVIWRQLKLFLEAIESSSQLVSIKFIDMGDIFSLIIDIIPGELFKTLISLFHSQYHLKTIVFQGGCFTKEEGSELLKAIFHSNSNIISNLTLREFVNDAPSMIISRQYILNLSAVYCKFATVQSLELDYTEIFEDLIHYLYEKLLTGDNQLVKKKPSMKTLNIYCDGRSQFRFKGITSETWKYLKNVLPELRVKMDVSVYGCLNSEIEKFVVKEMPLQSLHLRFLDSPTFATFEIPTLVRYLQVCHFQDHLEDLNVSF